MESLQSWRPARAGETGLLHHHSRPAPTVVNGLLVLAQHVVTSAPGDQRGVVIVVHLHGPGQRGLSGPALHGLPVEVEERLLGIGAFLHL